VLGGVLMAAGAVFLLAPGLTDSISQRAPYTIGSLLVGSGVPIFSLGVHTLFVKSPIEVSWDAYRAGKAPPPTTGKLEMSFGRLEGGGAFFANATF
jgi:hypothetical protein